jgi:hypothetical protein
MSEQETVKLQCGTEVPMPAWKDGIMYPTIDDGGVDDTRWPVFDGDLGEDGDWYTTSFFLEWSAEHSEWSVMSNREGDVDYVYSMEEWDETYEKWQGEWNKYYKWVADTGRDPLEQFFIPSHRDALRVYRINLFAAIGGVAVRCRPRFGGPKLVVHTDDEYGDLEPIYERWSHGLRVPDSVRLLLNSYGPFGYIMPEHYECKTSTDLLPHLKSLLGEDERVTVLTDGPSGSVRFTARLMERVPVATANSLRRAAKRSLNAA